MFISVSDYFRYYSNEWLIKVLIYRKDILPRMIDAGLVLAEFFATTFVHTLGCHCVVSAVGLFDGAFNI